MEKHVHFVWNIGLEMAKMHLKQFGKIGLVKGHVFRKDADTCLHTQNAAFLSCTCFSVSFVIGFPSDLNVFKAIQLVHQFWLQALEVFWVNSRSLKPLQWSWHPVWLTLLFAMLLRAATRGNFVMMSVWTHWGLLEASESKFYGSRFIKNVWPWRKHRWSARSGSFSISAVMDWSYSVPTRSLVTPVTWCWFAPTSQGLWYK